MKLKSSAAILCLSFLIASSGIGQEPQLLTKPGLLPELYGVLEKPDAPGTHPAVVILYGHQGWRPIYANIAKDLADSGFVALALDYYAYQGDDSGETGDLAVWHRAERWKCRSIPERPMDSMHPGLLGTTIRWPMIPFSGPWTFSPGN